MQHFPKGSEQNSTAPKTKGIRTAFEKGMNILFFLCGAVAVLFVLFISIYLIVSGIPAIREIGLTDFLFGDTWKSTSKDPQFGILPFILTSVYGTAGAIIIGVPIGFLTAVFLAKLASPRVAAAIRTAVELLSGIPSVVYGLIGMLSFTTTVAGAFPVLLSNVIMYVISLFAVTVLPASGIEDLLYFTSALFTVSVTSFVGLSSTKAVFNISLLKFAKSSPSNGFTVTSKLTVAVPWLSPCFECPQRIEFDCWL